MSKAFVKRKLPPAPEPTEGRRENSKQVNRMIEDHRNEILSKIFKRKNTGRK